MAEDAEDKSEDPTEKRLSQAREEGQIPISQEVKLWTGMVGILILVSMMGAKLSRDVQALMLPFIEHPHTFTVDRESMGPLLTDQVIGIIVALMFPMGMMLFLAVGANIAQTGLLFVLKRLAPDFTKLSPKAGLSRIFSLRGLVEFGKSLIKFGVVATVLFVVIRGKMNEFVGLAAVDMMAMLEYLRREAIHIIIIVLVMVTVLAAGDFFYQRWQFNQKMKMTKQEVKDEHKQSEGDPMIKGRLRSLRMQRARQRMMAAVPKADVVVTNPTHFACALKYDMENMSAPVLVAKGADLIAARIRELAEENEVPIVENPPLARALFATVELDQEIPPEHYKAVAEVIGYVMKLKGKLAR